MEITLNNVKTLDQLKGIIATKYPSVQTHRNYLSLKYQGVNYCGVVSWKSQTGYWKFLPRTRKDVQIIRVRQRIWKLSFRQCRFLKEVDSICLVYSSENTQIHFWIVIRESDVLEILHESASLFWNTGRWPIRDGCLFFCSDLYMLISLQSIFSRSRQVGYT